MRVWILNVLIFILFATSFSQTASKREWTIFQKGVREYKAGTFKAAEEHFRLVIEKLPDSQLSTAYHLMLAKTRYKLNRYTESLSDCQSFLNRFPKSKYRDDIIYLMANNQYQLNNYGTAVRNWIEAAVLTDDRRLKKKALNLAENTLSYRMDIDELKDFSRQWPTGTLGRDMSLYYLADHYYQKGDLTTTREIIDQLRQSGSNSVYALQADNLNDFVSYKNENVIRIGALLPLSGANADVGQGLYEGMQLAAETFSNSHNLDIEIMPFDYETRMTQAIKKMQEIASNKSILAVVGPVENDIAAACGIIADYEDIALISPTASSDELLDISDNLRLLSPTVTSMAENLNRFAVDSLKLNRIVSVSPLDDYFSTFTEAFTNRHIEKGGSVPAVQRYYPGDVDFSKQFKILKRIGLKLEFQDSVLQVDSTLAPDQVDSLYHLYQEEELEKLAETKTKIDSADIPVTSFDGLLVPIFKDDLSLIAPQIAYANIESQILGNSDWYNMEALKKNKNYINGIVFVADGYLNEESWDYRQFRNNFRNRFQKTPEMFSLIGYDSFNFLLNIFNDENAVVTRSNFAAKISELEPFRGVYRAFDLNNRSCNSAARILKYYYGQLIPMN